MARRQVDWVVVRDSGATALCERCGCLFSIKLPCILTVWCAAMKEFVKVHSKCTKPRGKPTNGWWTRRSKC
jgi:hypothetical protein